MTKEALLKKALLSALLVLLAVISVFLLAEKTSSNDMFHATISSIDEKTQHVLELSASSALISTGISALPNDTASPIANKLADFTGYFLLILCVLYTEKNILAVLGAAVFRFVIPAACALGIAALFSESRRLGRFSAKIAVFALVIFFAIPLSLKVSDTVYENHREIVQQALTEAGDMGEKSSQLSGAEDRNGLLTLLRGWKDSVSSFLDRGAQIINRFVESIAVFIVTSCVMPLLVLALILWLVKILFGIQIDFPRPGRKKKEEE